MHVAIEASVHLDVHLSNQYKKDEIESIDMFPGPTGNKRSQGPRGMRPKRQVVAVIAQVEPCLALRIEIPLLKVSQCLLVLVRSTNRASNY